MTLINRGVTLGFSKESLNRQLGRFLQATSEPASTSDVSGCVKKAAELVSSFDRDRYLIVATSARSGAPQVPGLKLDRVRVRLVYLQCDDPPECDQVKQEWSQAMISANAADIRFNDPSEGLTRVDLPRPKRSRPPPTSIRSPSAKSCSSYWPSAS